jgi:hypothetical protein
MSRLVGGWLPLAILAMGPSVGLAGLFPTRRIDPASLDFRISMKLRTKEFNIIAFAAPAKLMMRST